jgi:hypothetical protein
MRLSIHTNNAFFFWMGFIFEGVVDYENQIYEFEYIS